MSYEDILSIVFGSALAILILCLGIVVTVYAIKVGLNIDLLKKEKLQLEIRNLKAEIKLNEHAIKWNKKHEEDYKEIEELTE